MYVQPRRHLRGLPGPVHGSVQPDELRALGLEPGEIIDFSVNTNPFGPPPAVMDAWRNADIARYPDPQARGLRAALAERLGVGLENVLVGNGSVELMWLAALAYLGPGDRALVVGPTFGEYERAARIAGAEVVLWVAEAKDGFGLDFSETATATNSPSPCPSLLSPRARLRRGASGDRVASGDKGEGTIPHAKALFLCNPNNPTGVFVPPDTIRDLAGRRPETLVVIDEAYLPFVDAGASCLDAGLLRNTVVLRSMTKDYAIPGLRLGYAVAEAEIIQVLGSVQPTWSVSAPAQAAGLAALRCEHDFQAQRSLLGAAKSYLTTALTELGLAVLPSATNFFLVRVGAGAAFRRALLMEGCCVREGTSFGLADYVRIGVRTLPECEQLVAAVARVLKSKELGSMQGQAVR